MTTYYPAVVVDAVPPEPPQLSLLGSAIRPDSQTDPSSSTPPTEALTDLPADLVSELNKRKGEMWVRGITYAPEEHRQAEVRDPCDYTSIDLPAIPAPLGLEGKAVAGGGTVPAEELEYAVTAVNANGETTGSVILKITPLVEGHVVLTWEKVNDTAKYRVYRCKGGVKKPLRIKGALVPAVPGEGTTTVTYTDTGEATEGGKELPASNTTGGPGPYSNLPIVTAIPYLVVAEDWCSTWGWSERDYKGRALRLLENSQHQAIEREFWTGALAAKAGWPNNSLMNEENVTDLTPGAGAPSVARGMQILQDALQQNGFGGQGMLHCQAQTATNLLTVRRVGDLMLDMFDNIVVPGVGYPGTGPGGKEPEEGNAFMAASDLVCVRAEEEGTVFPDTFSEAMDWGQSGEPNTLRFRAEKFAVAYFDGSAQFSIEVKLAT